MSLAEAVAVDGSVTLPKHLASKVLGLYNVPQEEQLVFEHHENEQRKGKLISGRLIGNVRMILGLAG